MRAPQRAPQLHRVHFDRCRVQRGDEVLRNLVPARGPARVARAQRADGAGRAVRPGPRVEALREEQNAVGGVDAQTPVAVPTATERSATAAAEASARGRAAEPADRGSAKASQHMHVTYASGSGPEASRTSATHVRARAAASRWPRSAFFSETARVATTASRLPRATARCVALGASAMVTRVRACASTPVVSRISAGAGGPPSHSHHRSPKSITGSSDLASSNTNETSASRAGIVRRGASLARDGVPGEIIACPSAPSTAPSGGTPPSPVAPRARRTEI